MACAKKEKKNVHISFSLLSKYDIKYSVINLITNDAVFEVIKINVTPPERTVINEPDLSVFTNQVLHFPALAVHRLCAVTSLLSDDLNTDMNFLVHPITCAQQYHIFISIH